MKLYVVLQIIEMSGEDDIITESNIKGIYDTIEKAQMACDTLKRIDEYSMYRFEIEDYVINVTDFYI